MERHSDYRKAQFNGIPDKLRATLSEDPPVSLLTAATRVGHCSAYLGSRFPDVPGHLKALSSIQKEAELGEEEGSGEETSGYGSNSRFNRRIPFTQADKSRASCTRRTSL